MHKTGLSITALIVVIMCLFVSWFMVLSEKTTTNSTDAQSSFVSVSGSFAVEYRNIHDVNEEMEKAYTQALNLLMEVQKEEEPWNNVDLIRRLNKISECDVCIVNLPNYNIQVFKREMRQIALLGMEDVLQKLKKHSQELEKSFYDLNLSEEEFKDRYSGMKALGMQGEDPMYVIEYHGHEKISELLSKSYGVRMSLLGRLDMDLDSFVKEIWFYLMMTKDLEASVLNLKYYHLWKEQWEALKAQEGKDNK